MKQKTFQKVRAVLLFLVLVSVFLSVYLKVVFIGFLATGLGMVVLSFLKIHVKDTLEDERIKSINEKAARTSFMILLPILGLSSFALLSAAGGPFYYLHGLGVILGYVTLVALWVYLLAYFYFSRRFGG